MRCARPAGTEHWEIKKEFALLHAWLRDAAGRALRARRPRIRPDTPARRAEADVGRDSWSRRIFVGGNRHAVRNPDGMILVATGPRVDPHRRSGRVGEWEC